MLIGQDHSEALIPLGVRRGKPGEPFAIRSVLGWCLNGSAHWQCVSNNVVSNFISINETNTVSDELQENVQRLWQIENDGIDPIGLSQQDKLVLGLWEKSTRKVDGHFEMPIPWENSNSFPDNIDLAVGRFRSLVKRLKREELMDGYDEEITKLIEKGYAEKVPSNEIEPARLLLIKNAQRKCYVDEFRCLAAARDVTKSSPLHKLNPFLDGEGIIRVGGWIREHCIVIPHQHPIARAIVLYVHNQAHVGVEWTLGKVREKYWIVKVRPLVKKIVHSCVTCRMLYANPCTQRMADLPLQRL